MYHILPLTSEEIRNGALFQVSDALSLAFRESARAITEQGMRGDQEQMVVLFDNSSTNPAFHEEQGNNDVQDVLYMNDAAKDVVEKAGIRVNFNGTTDNPPQGHGLMAKMYRFVNLR